MLEIIGFFVVIICWQMRLHCIWHDGSPNER